MGWNWELSDWPKFIYDIDQIAEKERALLLGVGSAGAFLKTIGEGEFHQFIVEILSLEGLESSKIEGEILDRESLQSSIKEHFGLQTIVKKGKDKDSRMAKLVCSVYESFNDPLTDEMLWQWHSKLFSNADAGKYRTHDEPMQIVSNRYDSPIVFFEAPPSKVVADEMAMFIQWFNATRGSGSILGRAAVAHIYFESIHPFEDGNGRIGRAIVEKILSQAVGRPILIAVSKILEQRKKEYYVALEKCNRTLEVMDWVEFFAEAVLQAQEYSMSLLYFLIEKARLLTTFSGKINPRQEKALLRMFESGPTGFKGGLSAENYISITQTSKATATRDLIDLVQKGALIKTGELRHTRYWLNVKS